MVPLMQGFFIISREILLFPADNGHKPAGGNNSLDVTMAILG